MAFSLESLVLETTTAPGTGDAVLNGATAPFRAFGDDYVNGDTLYYTIRNNTQSEEGKGTYLSGTNAIQRDTVFKSSNGGSKVVFSGECNAYVTFPGNKVLVKDPADEVAGPVHITTSDVSGGAAASTADDLVLEVNGAGGLTIITPAANTATVAFADPASTTAGAITYNHSTNAMTLRVNDTNTLVLNSAGALFLGDSGNANSTAGVTINQGAADDEILSFKSSDVAHALTSVTETDTWLDVKKNSGADGGARVQAVMGGSTTNQTLKLEAYSRAGTSAKSASGVAPITLESYQHDGIGTLANIAADNNILAIRGYESGTQKTKAILDIEGDWHVDGSTTLTAFDDYDDPKLIAGLRGMLLPKSMAAKLGLAQWIEYARPALESTGVVTYNEDGRHFLSLKGALFLSFDAIRQMADRNSRLEKRVALLEKPWFERFLVWWSRSRVSRIRG